MSSTNKWAIFSGAVFAALFLFLNTADAAPTAQSTPLKTSRRVYHIPVSPLLNAKSYTLMDYQTGDIIAEKNADARNSPASLTKLMTLYVLFNYLDSGQIKLTDKVHISRKAWKMEGSRMFVNVNTDVKVEDLMHGVIVASGNDACVALSEYIAGTEEAFTHLMNQQAKVLGMKNSHFTDATGMPHKDHYSTSHDMAILARALIRDFPEYYKWFSQKWFNYNKIKQPNRNRLLWRYQNADGLKTGHTSSAGYCLVSSATKEDRRLISVVMGSESSSGRTEDSIRLLNYGFRFFSTHKVYGAGHTVASPRVWGGKNKTVKMGVVDDLFITMPKSQFKQLRVALSLPNNLRAPVKKGQQYGTVSINLHDKVLATRPLIALEDDPSGSLWQQLSDYIGLSMHRFFSKTGAS